MNGNRSTEIAKDKSCRIEAKLVEGTGFQFIIESSNLCKV